MQKEQTHHVTTTETLDPTFTSLLEKPSHKKKVRRVPQPRTHQLLSASEIISDLRSSIAQAPEPQEEVDPVCKYCGERHKLSSAIQDYVNSFYVSQLANNWTK